MVDLFCGVGGATEGFQAEGWNCIGFDIERHVYGDHAYPAQLVLQDVLTLHGSQFKDASLIFASPPCTEYSYMAMPWKRAKQIARALRGQDDFPEGYKGSRTIEELNALFNACFRIQRQASEAAGRHIPMVVENVRGAVPWVGRAKWNYGSYYLWGDVPALMPATISAVKAPGMNWSDQSNPNNRRSFTDSGGRKNPGFRFDGSGRGFQSESVANHVERVAAKQTGIKNGGDWFGSGADCSLQRRYSGGEHVKLPGCGWFNDSDNPNRMAMTSSRSPARKEASALIAKIPFVLAAHVARCYKPSSPSGETAAIGIDAATDGAGASRAARTPGDY